MNFTEYEDLILAKIDAERELQKTLDTTLRNIKAGHVISLAYYRQVVTKYKGWKPLSMKDYVLSLRGSRYQRVQDAMRRKRESCNKGVARSYNLPTKPKK